MSAILYLFQPQMLKDWSQALKTMLWSMEIVYIENVTLASQIGMIIPNSRYLPAILEATTSIQKLIRWSGEFA